MLMFSRRTLLVSGAAMAALAACGEKKISVGPRLTPPPAARIEPVTETFFGTSITDNYRWMENPKDPDWEPFMKGHADYARGVLDSIRGLADMKSRVSALSGDLEVIGGIEVSGPYVFINKRPAGADNFKLFVREGLEGAERLLIDPTALTVGETHYSLDYWTSSPDGKYIVYGLSPSGSEDSVIHIMDVATGEIFPERIDRVQYANPSWTPDGSGFFYNRLSGAEKGSLDYYKNSASWFHRLGTDPATDIKVLSRGQFADVEVSEIEFPYVTAQRGSDFVVGGLVAGVQNELTLYVATLADAVAGKGGWKPICSPADKVTGVAGRGAEIFLVTYEGAPRYKVVRVTAEIPSVKTAITIVPESESVIQGLATARDGIYIIDLNGGVSGLRKIGPAGAMSTIALPFAGTFGQVASDVEAEGVIIDLQSWVRPATAFRIGADGLAAETNLVAKPSIDVAPYEATQAFATAKDGTKVPLWIVGRRDVPRDGSAPVFMQAYGSYGINSSPFFGPRYIAFMEQGGLWCTANVRGGGEYGREWHEQGRLLMKPNTWGDLIACAEYLIAEKWSSANRITINGGSAGGITVGRAMTDRPDLFAAVVSQVGVSNTLRAEFSQNGPPNIPEFGSVATEDGFKGLLAMDSIQHVKAGVLYPAVLLTTGMNDPRVDPWNAAKMTAAMLAANPEGKPVLLRVEYQAGHGLGSTRAQRDAEWADAFAFGLWQSGAKGFAAG